MQFLSWRRSLLLLAVVVGLTGLTGLAGSGPAEAQTVRKSVAALSAAEVMSLRKGVAMMMSRDSAPRGSADFRRSWVYWANMHAHFGVDDDCRGPITGNGMSGVTVWTASDSGEMATWCGCKHHNNEFLTWHRMFVYYFEKVLREASGDPALTLPFWDYATNRRLPLIFREVTYVDEQGQTVPNPLRVEARRLTMNDGSGQFAQTTVSSSNAMAATTYGTFRLRLEGTPHGTVHCSLTQGGCGNGLMGSAASAALDPIFYLHHSNIDRLYQCWLGVNEAGRLPTGPIINRSYSFVDGDGTVVTRVVRDMLRTSQLGYGYATGAGCPAGAAGQMVAAGPVELQRGVTDVTIGIETPAGAAPATESKPQRRAVVHIAGLTAERTPGVMFNVFLLNAQGQREHIGVIDFFATDPAGGGGHDDHGAREFEFDATAAIEVLGLGQKSRFRLVFEPTTGLEGVTPEAAIEQMTPDAGVKFRRAWLEWD